MEYTVREFLRQFPEFRQKAESGESVQIRSGEKLFIFRYQGKSESLIGCCSALTPKNSFDIGPVEKAESWEID
jgi:hypothetical protein